MAGVALKWDKREGDENVNENQNQLVSGKKSATRRELNFRTIFFAIYFSDFRFFCAMAKNTMEVKRQLTRSKTVITPFAVNTSNHETATCFLPYRELTTHLIFDPLIQWTQWSSGLPLLCLQNSVLWYKNPRRNFQFLQ